MLLLLAWLYERGARHHTTERMQDLARELRRREELHGDDVARAIEDRLESVEPAMTASLLAPMIAFAGFVSRFVARLRTPTTRDQPLANTEGPPVVASKPASSGGLAVPVIVALLIVAAVLGFGMSQ